MSLLFSFLPCFKTWKYSLKINFLILLKYYIYIVKKTYSGRWYILGLKMAKEQSTTNTVYTNRVTTSLILGQSLQKRVSFLLDSVNLGKSAHFDAS